MKKNFKQLIAKIEVQILAAFILGFVVFLIISLYGHISGVKDYLINFPIPLAFTVLSLTLINYLLRYLRFRYLTRCLKVSLKLVDSLAIWLSGLSMTVTPGKSGELVKAYLIKKLNTGPKASFAAMASLVIFERFSDAVGTMLLMAGGLWYYQAMRWFLALVAGAIIGFAVIFSKPKIFDYVYLFLKKISFLNFLTNHLINFHQATHKLLTAKTIFISSFLAFSAWSFEIAGFALIFNQINHHLDIQTISVLAFIFTFTSILGFVTMMPGGLGVTEASKLSLLMVLLSVPKIKAVSIVILIRLFTLWFGVLLGIMALLYLSHRLGRADE